MAITLRPAHPMFVAEVEGVDMRELLSEELLARIVRAADEYAVLIFRDQAITDDQHVAFTSRFDRLETTIKACRADFKGRLDPRLAAHAMRIEGMEIPEGRILPRDLMEHAVQPRFVHTHRWRAGDMVMCDNRRTMHRACAYDPSEVREPRRTTVMEEAASLLDAVTV